MHIWYSHPAPTLESIQAMRVGTMVEYVGIEIDEIGEDFLAGRMPVDHRTRQPHGILHGGASAVLAETLGSIGGSLCVDPEEKIVVGLEINCNHIRSARSGFVRGIARPVHIGSTTHVWDIRITNEHGKLVCVSRLTLAVLRKHHTAETSA